VLHGSRVVAVVTADAAGHFAVALPTGTYRLASTPSGLTMVTLPIAPDTVHVTAGVTTRVSLRLLVV
jgi:hypothetical protein